MFFVKCTSYIRYKKKSSNVYFYSEHSIFIPLINYSLFLIHAILRGSDKPFFVKKKTSKAWVPKCWPTEAFGGSRDTEVTILEGRKHCIQDVLVFINAEDVCMYFFMYKDCPNQQSWLQKTSVERIVDPLQRSHDLENWDRPERSLS